MKFNNDTKQNRTKSPIKIFGTLFTASLLVFGATSCNEGGDVVEDEAIEEGFAEEGITATEPLANESVMYFTTWDTDADNQWAETEFITIFRDRGVFDEWDANNDNMYAEDEVYTGLYDEWDADNNNYLSEEEFGLGYGAWEDDYGDNWATWDANDDNILDTNEFNAGIGATNLYEDWDLNDDNMFDDNELYTGFFNTWDADDSGYIDTNEYNAIGFNTWYDNEL